MINIYKKGSIVSSSETGVKDSDIRAKVGKYTYDGTAMGERFVSFSYSHEVPVDWEIGDYLYVRGEKFTLNTLPSCKKQARKNTYGEAFVYDTVKFDSIVRELSSKMFFDYVPDDNNEHYTSLGTFSFYVGDIKQFAGRIQANLDRAYGEDDWIVEVKNVADFNSQNVSVSSGTSILSALSMINSSFGQNFVVSVKKKGNLVSHVTKGSFTLTKDTKVITIGKIEEQVSTNILVYGKGMGLKSLQKNFGSTDGVITRLHVYGSTRNLPYRYYNKSDRHKGIVGEARYMPNLMLPISYDGVTLWHSDNDKLDVYVDSLTSNFSVAGIEDHIGSLNDNKYEIIEGEKFFDSDDGDWKEIYPSLEGMNVSELPVGTKMYETGYTPDGTLLGVCSSWVNNSQSMTNITYSGSINEAYNYMRSEYKDADGNVKYKPTYDESTGTWNYYEMATYFINKLDPFTSRTGIGILVSDFAQYLESCQLDKDMKPKEGSLYHTLTAEEKTNIKNKTYRSEGRLNVITGGSTKDGSTALSDNGVSEDGDYSNNGKDTKGNSFTDVFYVKIPQIGFNLKDFVEESNPTISFKTGMCAGREFEIKSCVKINGGTYADGWMLKCGRKLDEDVNMYFPNSTFSINEGDEFVLLGILMPDVYVVAAENRLYVQAMKWLAENDHPKTTFSPEIDSIWAENHPDFVANLYEGLRLCFNDTDKESNAHDLGLTGNGESITITKLSIKYGESSLPKYEVTLSDDEDNQSILAKMANSIAKNAVNANNAIKSLSSTVDSNKENTDSTIKEVYSRASSGGGSSSGGSSSGEGTTFEDAPKDGNMYGRKDGAWLSMKFFNETDTTIMFDVGGKMVNLAKSNDNLTKSEASNTYLSLNEFDKWFYKYITGDEDPVVHGSYTYKVYEKDGNTIYVRKYSRGLVIYDADWNKITGLGYTSFETLEAGGYSIKKKWAIGTKQPFFSEDNISCFKYSNDGGGSNVGGVTSFAELDEVAGAAWSNGQTLIYSNGQWVPGKASSDSISYNSGFGIIVDNNSKTIYVDTTELDDTYALKDNVVNSIGGKQGAIKLVGDNTGNGTINLSIDSNKNLSASFVGTLGSLAWKDSLSYSDVGAAASSHTHSQYLTDRGYIGTTKVQETSKNQALSGITNINTTIYISSGKVGIGKSSPSYNIDVNGSANISGNSNFCGNYNKFGNSKGIYFESNINTKYHCAISTMENLTGISNGFVAGIYGNGDVYFSKYIGIQREPIHNDYENYSLHCYSILAGKELYTVNADGSKTYNSEARTILRPGSIDLYGAQSFVDFHARNSESDYTVRLINWSSDRSGINNDYILELMAGNNDPALKIGDAFIKYDKTNKALYVCDKDGKTMHFYAMGNVSAFGGLGTYDTIESIEIKNSITIGTTQIYKSTNKVNSNVSDLYIVPQTYTSGTKTYYGSVKIGSVNDLTKANYSLDVSDASIRKAKIWNLILGENTTDDYTITSVATKSPTNKTTTSSSSTSLFVTIGGVEYKIYMYKMS